MVFKNFMKKFVDAYGQELWSFYKGKEINEIIERDDGYIDAHQAASTYFSEYKDWKIDQKKVMASIRGRVLDVGCGAGRHSLYLQKKGLKVTGIDNSPLAIKICKLRGIKNALIRPIEEINKFKPGSFDNIIMMGNNFGLMGSYRKAKLLLKKFYYITSKNALIIAECKDPYKTNDPVHLSYHKYNKKRGRLAGQLRIRVRYEKFIGKWFDYLFVSKGGIKEILKNTGWRIKKFINSGDSNYIAIIEKINI